MRKASLCMGLVVLLLAGLGAQTTRVERDREFSASLPAVKAALQNLGAYTGNRLPSLDGFVNLEGVNQADFQRPYYEYKIDLEPSNGHNTIVKVRATVSAWYPGQNGEAGSYRNFESNGHLETDLLDRLGQYLVDKSDDPNVLTTNIQKVRAEREQAERDIAAESSHANDPQPTKGVGEGSEFAVVSQPNVPVLSAPAGNSKTLLHARLDDEFRILERRGTWVSVALGDSQSGWVNKNQVEISVAIRPGASEKVASAKPGFNIIRQSEDDFEGDWQPLKGKKALYLFAQPDGAAMNVATGNRWHFVESVFNQQYLEIAHTPESSIQGIVIIFMDQGGGVAAARLDDIRSWVEGSLNKAQFIKRCSLDPPSAFANAESSTGNTRSGKRPLSSAKNPPRS